MRAPKDGAVAAINTDATRSLELAVAFRAFDAVGTDKVPPGGTTQKIRKISAAVFSTRAGPGYTLRTTVQQRHGDSNAIF